MVYSQQEFLCDLSRLLEKAEETPDPRYLPTNRDPLSLEGLKERFERAFSRLAGQYDGQPFQSNWKLSLARAYFEMRRINLMLSPSGDEYERQYSFSSAEQLTAKSPLEIMAYLAEEISIARVLAIAARHDNESFKRELEIIRKIIQTQNREINYLDDNDSGANGAD